MPLRRAALSAISCMALVAPLLLCRDAHASAGTIGGETHINTRTAGDQSESANASSANGRTVVVWTHRPADPAADSDIRAQIYDANKNPLPPTDLKVATTGAIESDPAVGIDGAGNFVVVWTRRANATATDSNILGARFTLAGARLGNLIVATSSRIEFDPSVARSSDGDIVVTHTSAPSSDPSAKDVFAKMFNSGGAFIKTIPIANTSTAEQRSTVGRSASGSFAVGYQVGANIVLRRYSDAGNVIGVHTIAATTRAERSPSVGVDDGARTFVSWQEHNGNWQLRGRSVSDTGAIGAVLSLASTAADETRPAVTVDRSDGDRAVAYQVGGGSASRVRVTELSVIGVIRGTFDLGPRRAAPAISLDGSDLYMVTYTSNAAGSGDAGRGIFGRIGSLE